MIFVFYINIFRVIPVFAFYPYSPGSLDMSGPCGVDLIWGDTSDVIFESPSFFSKKFFVKINIEAPYFFFKSEKIFPGKNEKWNWIDFRVRSAVMGWDVADVFNVRVGYFSRKAPSLKSAFAVEEADISNISGNTLFSLTEFGFSTHGGGAGISWDAGPIQLGAETGFFYSVIEEGLSYITFAALEERLTSRNIRGEKWSVFFTGGIRVEIGDVKCAIVAGFSKPVSQNQVILTLTTTHNYFTDRETYERDLFSSSRKADEEIYIKAALTLRYGNFEPFAGASFILQRKEVFLFPVEAGLDGVFFTGLKVRNVKGVDLTGGIWYEYLNYPDPSPTNLYVLKYASKGAGFAVFKAFPWGKTGFAAELAIFDGVMLNYSPGLSDLDGITLKFRILTEIFGS